MERNTRWRNIMLVIIGLFALVFALGGKTLLPSSVTASPEVKNYAQSTLVELDGTGTDALLSQHSGKPALLFVYASWCPYCKKQFAMLKALQSRYASDQLAISYIALDEDAYDLSRFLMDNYPQLPFTPYHVSPANRESFSTTLIGHGFTPDGAIPHLLLFAPSGKPVKEFKGLTPIPELLDAVQGVM
jgi:thiol-disulfide isomerase/thioredoxin